MRCFPAHPRRIPHPRIHAPPLGCRRSAAPEVSLRSHSGSFRKPLRGRSCRERRGWKMVALGEIGSRQRRWGGCRCGAASGIRCALACPISPSPQPIPTVTRVLLLASRCVGEGATRGGAACEPQVGVTHFTSRREVGGVWGGRLPVELRQDDLPHRATLDWPTGGLSPPPPPCGDRRPKAKNAAHREPERAGARLSQKGRRSRRVWARRVRSSPGRAVAGADAPAVAPAAGCLAAEVNRLVEEPVLNTGGESLA